MKAIRKYMAAAGILLASALAFSSCQDDFNDEIPHFHVPVATHDSNMSIYDLKMKYFEGTDTKNSSTVIGEHPDKPGEHIYIKGRVCSDDRSGNIFKKLMVQDETAAIAFSIDSYDLYLNYRYGQEVVIDMTGLNIGFFNGQYVVGAPQYYEAEDVYETGRMPLADFVAHTELNGVPEPSKVRIEKLDLSQITNNEEWRVKYVDQLVRFNNVYFPDADGKVLLSEYKSSGVDRMLLPVGGTKGIKLCTSGYSDFWNNPLPEGAGDVVGIITYNRSNEFQLNLLNLDGLMNFGNPTLPKGESPESAYTIDEVIELIRAGGTGDSGWAKGYIVGSVKPNVTEITGNDDIEWSANSIFPGTVVIAPYPEIKEIASCLVIALPQGSALREYANLVAHPENYGRQMWIKGTFRTEMGAYAVSSTGNATDFRIEGVDVPGSEPVTPGGQGDGSEANPYTITQALSIYNGSAASQPVWVECYIVGSCVDKTYDSATFTADGASGTNIVVAETPGTTDLSKCMPVQLPAGNVRTALNLQNNPQNLYKKVILHGTIEKYFGTAGIKNVTEFKWEGSTPENPDKPDTPDTPSGDGTGTQADPWNVAKVFSLYEGGSTGTTGWMTGYIVGSCVDKTFDSATFTANGASGTNILVAASPSETDYNKCIPVQLPAGTVRNALNLQANPGNLGSKVLLNGTIEKYFGVAGFKSVTDYKLDGGSTTPDNPDTPDTPVTGNGSESAPLTVAAYIASFNAGGSGDSWVEGYIVGSCPGMSFDTATFTATDASNTNVLLANTPGETDYTKCLPIQLPTGDVRTNLSLQANPANLGRKVKLNGSMEKYFGVAGMKSTKSYTFM